jgi:hypothetical protein
MSRNYGDQFVDSVRQYMQANEIKSLGGINGTLLADLSQRFYEKFTGAQKTRRKLECEEDWIVQLEADPVSAGLDVRRELGKAKFWCRENSRVCTRRFFSNWLIKAERPVGGYDGATSRPRKVVEKPKYTVDKPVPGWPLIVRTLVCVDRTSFEIDEFCAKDWDELPAELREKIIAVA